MKGLWAAILRRQPIAAPVIVIGLLVLTVIGGQFLDDHHAASWIKWLVGAPWCAFVLFVAMALNPGDVDDD